MKLLAPIVVLLGLSFLLYNTRDVWPKDEYDVMENYLGRGKTYQATVRDLQQQVKSGRLSVDEASRVITKKLMKGQVVQRGFSSPQDALSRSIISMDLD